MKTIRRLYFYAVSAISIEVVLWGVIGLLRSILDSQDISNNANNLASALALIFVGVPIFLIHWGWAQSVSSKDSEEGSASIRAVFLYGILLGTLILFVLDRVRVPTPWGRLSGLDMINNSLAPLVTGILQLPRQTAQVLVLGFLRRDYGAAGLYDMVRQGLMSPVQIVVSLIVLTLFIPCVANFFMIVREQGTKKALIILGFITPFAIAVGGIVNVILQIGRAHV